MSIKLDYYKVFCKVAECKSFSAAAKRLYMTQPAVSQTIIQLEKELDICLFRRGAKGVVLTNEGSNLYEYIHTALNLIEVGEKKIKESLDLVVGELKIGVGDTISRFFLLPYLEKFHDQYPNIKLKIINRTTTEQCELLKAGEIDLAICNLPIEDTALDVKEYFYIHDIFVGGEAYKKFSKNPIALEELTTLPLIFLEKKSNSRRYVEKYLEKEGLRINPEIELGSHDLLLEFARINLGISCVIKEFSKEYLDQKGIYEIRLMNPIPRRSVGCCFLKSVPLSPASFEFLKILEESEKNS
ncbi:LysR family transcriptional regulator [Niameybacter sp.]|uniref:LysR family transcriptional regulator n=1 Tax=Niameybacter sp. TaxID=2033640 RepID=UPI002FC68381